MNPLLQGLPELGVGMIYWPSLEGLLDLGEQPIDVLEVEPQPFWFGPAAAGQPYELDSQVFAHLRSLPQPTLVHGVGFPIGGTVAPAPGQVAAFVETIGMVGAPWCSEHLSFNRARRGAGEQDLGFLLPPIQSPEGVATAVANIKALEARLPVPFAFETGVSYFKPRPGELSDGAFFAAVARAADCGILLDLHNVWANERNGRQPVLELVDDLPLERVVEVHLAGGQEYEGVWVDAHSGPVSAELMELARWVIPRLPNLKAIIFEVMPQYVVANGISKNQLTEQLGELRELWNLRGHETGPPSATGKPQGPGNEEHSMLPSPLEWERALGEVVTGRSATRTALAGELHADRGASVLRTLIAAARAGRIADTLALTTRLFLLTLGESRLQQILEDFWDTVPSEQMASHEALNFATYITRGNLTQEVPYLVDVTNFELAAHRAVMTGEPQVIRLGVDPEPLLAALRRGRMPQNPAHGDFELTVAPPVR